MANFENFLNRVIKPAEGSGCTPNDYKGGSTRIGVSAELLKDATGISLTDAQLCARDEATIIRAIRWVWDKLKGDQIKSQSVAEIIIDHAFNKGWVRVGYQLQYFLNRKYGSGLVVDGKIGPLSIAAINAAVTKYTEAQVYADFREYRRLFYLGQFPYTDNLSGPYVQGYENPSVGANLIRSRLDIYFPTNGINSDENANGNPLSTSEKAKAATGVLFNPKSWKDWVILILILVALFFGVRWIIQKVQQPKVAAPIVATT